MVKMKREKLFKTWSFNLQDQVMIQAVNHATGDMYWKMMPADYDYSQELARWSKNIR